MKSEETIEVLNTLITINNFRIIGYESASNITDEQNLKTLFAQFTATSQNCKQELKTEVKRLGGIVDETIITFVKLLHIWVDVLKAALLTNDRKVILKSCEFGEEITVETYFMALRNNTNYITAEQQIMINEQHNSIKEDLNTIKAIRDALSYSIN